MLVRFTKARHADRPHTLTCVRDDGSTIGQRSTEFFVQHDLTHFAIETMLGFREAFYGLLNQGWDFSSFEERQPGTRKVRRYPAQAAYAECLAGSYDLEITAGPLPDLQRFRDLCSACAAAAYPAPNFDPGLLAEVRKRRADLHRQWSEVEPGETLELVFAS